MLRHLHFTWGLAPVGVDRPGVTEAAGVIAEHGATMASGVMVTGVIVDGIGNLRDRRSIFKAETEVSAFLFRLEAF
jgi:hypothetical protein